MIVVMTIIGQTVGEIKRRGNELVGAHRNNVLLKVMIAITVGAIKKRSNTVGERQWGAGLGMTGFLGIGF